MTRNNNGILIPAQDPRTIVNAIEFMVKQPEDMIRMGINSRIMAVSKFDSKIIINEFFKIYELPLREPL